MIFEARELALLAGWGMAAEAMVPLAAALKSRLGCDVRPTDLPYTAPLSHWPDVLDGRIADGAVLIGWSFGGQIAADLAARRQTACPALVTLASNPCFTARPDWQPAMTEADFQTFSAAFRTDPAETLKRFALICARGADNAGRLGRTIQRVLASPDSGLEAGLDALGAWDSRPGLCTYAGPQMHVFGGRDVLVPGAAAGAVRNLIPRGRVDLLADACHALPLQCPDALADRIAAFLAGAPSS